MQINRRLRLIASAGQYHQPVTQRLPVPFPTCLRWHGDRNYLEALELSRQAIEIAVTVNRNDEVNRFWLQRHVRAAWSALSDVDASTKRILANETLVLAQRAVTNDLGQIISRMSARFAAGDPQLREILRNGEELAREQEVLEAQLAESFSLGQEEQLRAFTNIRVKLAAIEQRGADIPNRVQASFPDYFRLVKPEAAQQLGISLIGRLANPPPWRRYLTHPAGVPILGVLPLPGPFPNSSLAL